jgi:hypothetical protein
MWLDTCGSKNPRPKAMFASGAPWVGGPSAPGRAAVSDFLPFSSNSCAIVYGFLMSRYQTYRIHGPTCVLLRLACSVKSGMLGVRQPIWSIGRTLGFVTVVGALLPTTSPHFSRMARRSRSRAYLTMVVNVVKNRGSHQTLPSRSLILLGWWAKHGLGVSPHTNLPLVVTDDHTEVFWGRADGFRAKSPRSLHLVTLIGLSCSI